MSSQFHHRRHLCSITASHFLIAASALMILYILMGGWAW